MDVIHIFDNKKDLPLKLRKDRVRICIRRDGYSVLTFSQLLRGEEAAVGVVNWRQRRCAASHSAQRQTQLARGGARGRGCAADLHPAAVALRLHLRGEEDLEPGADRRGRQPVAAREDRSVQRAVVVSACAAAEISHSIFGSAHSMFFCSARRLCTSGSCVSSSAARSSKMSNLSTAVLSAQMGRGPRGTLPRTRTWWSASTA